MQVQQRVHLDGRLVLAKSGPREQRQAEVDGGRVQRVQTLIQVHADRTCAGRTGLCAGTGRAARMIHLPASVREYLCLRPCDMRRSFDGLHALVREHLELDAFAGHLFVFASRGRDRVKILYGDRDGFAMWSKRLSGIDLQQARRRKRYQRCV